ncbi:hypothetical protein EGW08_012570, partial [Elysia chlorotica]
MCIGWYTANTSNTNFMCCNTQDGDTMNTISAIGENFKFYPKGTHFSCVEPSPHHDSVWKKRLESYRHIKLVDCFHTYAESMPDVKSGSYDVVVSTLTLCTVRDPPSVLKEIHRVL